MVTNEYWGTGIVMGHLTENNSNETQTKNVIFAPVALPIPFRFAGRTRLERFMSVMADGGGASSVLLSGPGPQFQHQTVTAMCS